ncbi:TonB-dependent siderophore receptor [uncultured Thiohalocapsa sp.]|uniref:TonB-dependent receptor plug domain-containing protein n=1 Tax=uncultured Thiohalocapsa sp. TaxID=768990 RepID=UPI0025D1AC90|nr:TonB-dependent receptor [uncultured Thiohalocapsa sp.]
MPAVFHHLYAGVCAIMCIVGTSVAGAGAGAQGTAPRGDDLLDLPFDELLQVEIKSAGKRAEEIRDIPASVTIVTRDEIARYGWQTLEQVLAHTPGFFVLSNTEERFIGTRGAVGGGVQFLVNGIAQHPSRQKTLTVPEIARLDIPVESIDRIEIIRGPMSVIYGNNAFQGVVNIVADAIAERGPRVSASGGNRGTAGAFARLGQQHRDSFWLLNAGARRDDGLAGAYADMMSPEQLAALDPAMNQDMDGDTDQQTASVQLAAGWRGLRADLRWNQRDYGIYALTPAFDDGTRIRLDTLHASLGYAHRFDDRLGLRVTATHSQEHYDTYQADFLFPDIDADQDQSARRWELELDLHWRPEPRLDTLFGYRFLQVDQVRNRIESALLLDATDHLDDYRIHDLFAEAGWQIHPQLRLVAGARLSLLPGRYRFERDNRRTGQRTATTLRLKDDKQLNGRAALLWSPNDYSVVKLIWGTASQDTGDASFAALEQIQTLELNTRLTRARWMLSASLFQNRIDNIARSIQVLDTATGDYLPVDDNSGRWRTRGLEVILDARPLPDLSLSASLTWQHTEDRASGIEPGYSPALLAKLRADYRRGSLTYAAYARYLDALNADWDFVTGPVQGVVSRIGERVPAYWDIGLNLRWQPRAEGAGPYAALNVSNLLDTDNRDPANELTDLDRGLIGPGRTLTVTLGYAF